MVVSALLVKRPLDFRSSPTTPPPMCGRAPVRQPRKRDDCIGVCVGYASGVHRSMHQVIIHSAKLGEGGFGAGPHR